MQLAIAADAPPAVRLSKSTKGEMVFSFAGKTLVVPELVIPRTIDGVTFAPDETEKGLVITTPNQKNVRVEVKELDGWGLRLTEGSGVRLAYAGAEGALNVQASSKNHGDLEMIFPDGGKALLSADGSVHFESFKDQSYFLTGEGKVRAIDADGTEHALGRYDFPMAGGLLKRYTSKKGEARWRRATAWTEILISGNAGEELELTVGFEKFTLKPGANRKIESPNGTVVEFNQNPATKQLEWKVERGFCRFWVESVQWWSATGLTGQSASMVWHAGSAAVDVRNTTTKDALIKRDLLVMISRRVPCLVPPGVTFQYANVRNGVTFNCGALGGTVMVYNPEVDLETPVQEANQAFRNALPKTTEAYNVHRITIGWSKEQAKLLVHGSLGDYVIDEGKGEVLKDSRGKKVGKIEYSEGSKLTFAAMESKFQIEFGPLKEWPIDVPPGNTFTMVFNLEKNVYIFTASPNNEGPLLLSTPDGNKPSVNPGMGLTIQSTTSETVGNKSEGYIVYAEGGGAGVVNTYGSAPDSVISTIAGSGLRNSELRITPDYKRIVEEPVSVSGK